jgi:hypothetical protein
VTDSQLLNVKLTRSKISNREMFFTTVVLTLYGVIYVYLIASSAHSKEQGVRVLAGNSVGMRLEVLQTQRMAFQIEKLL